ncbi:MATE family efflux transporter [Vibrio sinaloensis]|nr:MATE family efflux transporter [Vibrio sinaloensis]
MLTISTPAIAAQILNPVAIAVITSLVAQYGDSAIAAYGIATRIESLLLTGILALSVILTPFVAQKLWRSRKSKGWIKWSLTPAE